MKKDIVNHLFEIIYYLDGRGLVVTDEDLLKESLKSELGDFKVLKGLIKREV